MKEIEVAKKILPVCGIYSLTNRVNGKRYIGSSNNIKKRFVSGHLSKLGRGVHDNIKLQRAWLKYGEDQFDIEILEIVSSRSDLFEREQFWIDHYDAASPTKGYNIAPGAGGGKGIKQSPEVIEKRVQKLRGRPLSEETKRKIGEGNKGKVRSPEHRAIISEMMRNREYTPEMREKRRQLMLGRKMPRDGVLKSVESRKGYTTSEETKQKQRLKKLGTKQSPEVIAKRVASIKARQQADGYVHPLKGVAGRKSSPDTKEKQRIAAIKREQNRKLGLLPEIPKDPVTGRFTQAA